MFTPRVGALLSALTLALSAAAVPTAVVSPSAAVPSTTAAAPAVHPNVFEVYDPAITSPKQGDVWTAGAQQTVTWDASQIGADGKNTTAMLLLGHQMPGDLSEYLDLSEPSLFVSVGARVLTGGRREPAGEGLPRRRRLGELHGAQRPGRGELHRRLYVQPRSPLSQLGVEDCPVVGSVSDSGNASPVFTIQNANLPGAPSTLSSTVAAPTPAPSTLVASTVSTSLPAVSSAFTTVV